MTALAALRQPSPSEAMAALVAALEDPACYSHAVDRVEVLETHISYVLLAGDFAYKLKKPVRLPFLDFTSAEDRRRYCEEEVRINRRSAPGIYLGVVAIAGDPRGPRVNGSGPVLEHAVMMRRFGQESLFSAMAASGRLEPQHVDALAEAVARLHAGAERSAPGADRGHGERHTAEAMANFAEISRTGAGTSHARRLPVLQGWTCEEAARLAGQFAERANAGFERECHGDLHLANVALVDGEPVPFDAIEFSAPLRWIDVASDVAFTAMDLHRYGLPRLAARFVDRYLAVTGDYGALAVLRYYMVYRAMVRAKVAAIALDQARAGSSQAKARRQELAEYVELAERLSRPGPGLVVAMHGLPASGKSTVAGQLAEALGGVRVRSDVERKRLHGLAASARAGAGPGEGIYTGADTRATYDRLAGLARIAVAAGYPVVVDATFERRADRDRFRSLARECGAAFRIVSCVAPEAVLRERIVARGRQAGEASDADLAILEHRLTTGEPLRGEEDAWVVDTTLPGGHDAVGVLAQRLPGATA